MWLNTILNNVWRVSDDTPSISFGGLEPYLSSVASASLVESLSGSYNKPSGVAHVSFNSFTLGKTPPMIRGIEVLRIDGDTSVVYMTIDVGILMDAELLLDISPSSLDYKMVPTTVLSINSLDAELQLDVSVKSIPSYPYISNVNVSLSHEIPDFSLRIEPRSQK
jgi:Ca2+-dependent lipid-binding protein